MPAMNPVKIDCANAEWKLFLKHTLQDGREVELANFDYTLDGQFCEMLAMAHNAVFSLDAARNTGRFRKKSAPPGGPP
jgi:hypothetical protein